MLTVNDWIDANMKLVYGKKIRVIDTNTNKGVGDELILYMKNKVVNSKITSRFVFLYVV
jgi:hypothetical protein